MTRTTKATNKKPTISIRVDGKTYPISKQTWELLGKLFKISEQPNIYHELRAYKGIGKTYSEKLAQALQKPIIYPTLKDYENNSRSKY